MFNRSYESSGCLISLLSIALIIFLIKKLWWFVLIIIILFMLYPYIALFRAKLAQKKAEQERFKPETGQTYKICPFCGEKVRVTELKCPKCGGELG